MLLDQLDHTDLKDQMEFQVQMEYVEIEDQKVL